MFVACISLVMRQACLQVMRQGISSPSYSNIVHNQYIDKFNIASETKTLGGDLPQNWDNAHKSYRA